jgi:hypothetical protein
LPELKPKLFASPESKPQVLALPEFKPKPLALPELKPKLFASPESKPQVLALPEFKPKPLALPEHAGFHRLERSTLQIDLDAADVAMRVLHSKATRERWLEDATRAQTEAMRAQTAAMQAQTEALRRLLETRANAAAHAAHAAKAATSEAARARLFAGRSSHVGRPDILAHLAEERARGNWKAISDTVDWANDHQRMKERGWRRKIKPQTLHHWEREEKRRSKLISSDSPR